MPGSVESACFQDQLFPETRNVSICHFGSAGRYPMNRRAGKKRSAPCLLRQVFLYRIARLRRRFSAEELQQIEESI